ncbi:MAG TPA: coenzyme F420-0:L-glutamate ligase [Actinomycetota bacterium]|nr:coenzyme F420-0:L-glutamate ligase [Actinomycetota bacterium]
MIGREVRIIPLIGIPEIQAGDDLAGRLASAASSADLADGDVVVVTHKVVSKAEGRIAAADNKAHVVETESHHILRRTPGGMTISETRHGFVCANAGVDESNVPLGSIAMLPVDPDASARRIRAKLANLTGANVAVIISDTFGRAWRVGQTDVAIGVAGMSCFNDYRGTSDSEGRELHATRIAVADELAGAAELVMGKADGICAAIIRGARVESGRGAASELVRPPGEDLFR